MRESQNVVDALALVSPAISKASTLANEGRHGHLARVHPVIKAPRPGERARRCVARGCQLISSMAHLLPCELHAAAKGAAPALTARAVAFSALLLAERGAAFYLVVAWETGAACCAARDAGCSSAARRHRDHYFRNHERVIIVHLARTTRRGEDVRAELCLRVGEELDL